MKTLGNYMKTLDNYYKNNGIVIMIGDYVLLSIDPDNVDNNIYNLTEGKMKINWLIFKEHLEKNNASNYNTFKIIYNGKVKVLMDIYIDTFLKNLQDETVKLNWNDIVNKDNENINLTNETSELHDLETLKDEYSQLMTEQELSEHNKKMFFRLFKKWSDDNDRLLKKMERVDSQIAALEDKYGYDL